MPFTSRRGDRSDLRHIAASALGLPPPDGPVGDAFGQDAKMREKHGYRGGARRRHPGPGYS